MMVTKSLHDLQQLPPCTMSIVTATGSVQDSKIKISISISDALINGQTVVSPLVLLAQTWTWKCGRENVLFYGLGCKKRFSPSSGAVHGNEFFCYWLSTGGLGCAGQGWFMEKKKRLWQMKITIYFLLCLIHDWIVTRVDELQMG